MVLQKCQLRLKLLRNVLIDWLTVTDLCAVEMRCPPYLVSPYSHDEDMV